MSNDSLTNECSDSCLATGVIGGYNKFHFNEKVAPTNATDGPCITECCGGEDNLTSVKQELGDVRNIPALIAVHVLMT